MISVALATEDPLSEAVGRRLLQDASTQMRAELLLRRQGSGYLRSKMKSWLAMARQGQPVLLLTDLDKTPCAAELVQDWLCAAPKPDVLVMRVAVREIESWLLADHAGMRSLLGHRCRLPGLPDELNDPKSKLIELAKRARRTVRDEIVRAEGSSARQGVGYNRLLCDFALSTWDPVSAGERSPSLRRARIRIDELGKLIHAS